MNNFPPNSERCSLCGRPKDKHRKLIAGPNGFICDECVVECNKVLLKNLDYGYESDHFPQEQLPKPSEIKTILDEYVIGQDRAKRAMAVAVYNHYKRIQLKSSQSDVEL